MVIFVDAIDFAAAGARRAANYAEDAVGEIDAALPFARVDLESKLRIERASLKDAVKRLRRSSLALAEILERLSREEAGI